MLKNILYAAIGTGMIAMTMMSGVGLMNASADAQKVQDRQATQQVISKEGNSQIQAVSGNSTETFHVTILDEELMDSLN